MNKLSFGMITTLLVTTFAGTAFADEVITQTRSYGGQRTVGVGVTAGLQGAGLVTRLGAGPVGLKLSGLFAPTLYTYDKELAADETEADRAQVGFMPSWRAGADVYLLPWSPANHIRVGLSGGYRYDTVLQHGGAAGIDVEIDLSKHLSLVLSPGVTIFPDGEDRLRAEEKLPTGAEFTAGTSPAVGGGINLTLFYY